MIFTPLRTLIISLLLSSGFTHVHAQIRTDASLGQAAQSLTGPKFLVPETLGKLAGNNLFHSFQTFNIGTGESATFTTTTPTIANIFSRVTGGSASTLNGALKVEATAGKPNFFFINPAGVTFGAGTSIDVPGAFLVSTADYIKFPDGKFHVDTAKASTFSSESPEVFGFLGATREAISIKDGGALATIGQSITAVGGDVEINGGSISTQEGGDIRVVALGQRTREISFTGTLPAAYGNLRVTNGGVISSSTGSATDAGTLKVSAGTISIDDYSSISSDSWLGVGNAGNIEILAMNNLSIMNGGMVSSTAKQTTDFFKLLSYFMSFDISQLIAVNFDFTKLLPQSSGNAGTVNVKAGSIIIDGKDSSGTTGISTSIDGIGNAGNIVVLASGNLKISNGFITSDAEASSAGNAGAVRVSAKNISIDGKGSIFNFPRISSDTRGSGNAGSVDLFAAGKLSIVNGGEISSSTHAQGDAGSVNVTAGSMFIDGETVPVFTGIFSEASPDSTGRANAVKVTVSGNASIINDSYISSSTFSVGDGGTVDLQVAGNLSILKGGNISSNTFSSGNAGPVKVSANQILIDGPQGWPYTGIFSDTNNAGSTGNAGIVVVSAAENIFINHGRISSKTSSAGIAGTVSVNAGNLLVRGSESSINASATSGSSGQTGNVTVLASNDLLLFGGGELAIRNDATVSNVSSLIPTTLTVTAPSITLKNASISAASTSNVAASNIVINPGKLLYLDPSSITTSANQGNGGSITINGSSMVFLDKSQITTSVTGLTGNGGDITINAKALAMNTGFIQANTAASNASGGNIAINVDMLIPSNNSLLVGGDTPYTFNSNIPGYNVIQAAAPTGVSGTINVTSPTLDLSGSLTGLSAKVMNPASLGRNPCRAGGGSSLSLVGRGGLPPAVRGPFRIEATVSGATLGSAAAAYLQRDIAGLAPPCIVG